MLYLKTAWVTTILLISTGTKRKLKTKELIHNSNREVRSDIDNFIFVSENFNLNEILKIFGNIDNTKKADHILIRKCECVVKTQFLCIIISKKY